MAYKDKMRYCGIRQWRIFYGKETVTMNPNGQPGAFQNPTEQYNPPKDPGSGNKGNGGLKAALIAACVALVAVVTVIVLFLTGVFGGSGASGGGTSGSGRTGNIDRQEDETDDGTKTPEAYDAEIARVPKEFYLDENGGTVVLMETAYETLTMADAPQRVVRVLDEINEDRAEEMRDSVLDYAQTLHDAFYAGSAYWPWQMLHSVQVERADADVVSFAETVTAYYGGTHGSTTYYGHTLDGINGREYELLDIVTEYELLALAIEEEMEENREFREVLAYYREEGTSFAEYFTESFLNDVDVMFVPWTVTEEGLHIWFNDYTLGAYAFGALDILVPYENHPDLFMIPEFFENADVRNPARDRVTRSEAETGYHHLRDYCWEEEGFFPMDYTDVAGVYLSDAGDEFEIHADGGFSDGTGVSRGEYYDTVYGILRANPGGCNLYYYSNSMGPDGMPEREYYGTLAFIDRDTIDLDTLFAQGTYRRQSGDGMGGDAPALWQIAMEQGLGSGTPTAIADGEREGYWEDPVLGNGLRIYEYRGEFEAFSYATGDSWTGDIIYNGNYDEPRYTLRTGDGYDLADMYFFYYDLNGTQVPVLSITLHYAEGDYTTKYIKW